MRTTLPVNDTVRDVLTRCRIDGLRLYLPELDPKVYRAVNAVLSAMGGTWNRRAKAHVFPTDPSDLLAVALRDGAVSRTPAPKILEAFFATPAPLAATILAETDIASLEPGAHVLEPSAGDGALVRAVFTANPSVHITAVEPHRERAASLVGDPRVSVVPSTFEQYAELGPRQHFAAAVMNPPFALPGEPTVWISHVLTTWTMLAAGGHLVAIVPGGFVFRRDRHHAAMRELIAAYGSYRELPDDAFAAAGADDVRTVLIQARRHDLAR